MSKPRRRVASRLIVFVVAVVMFAAKAGGAEYPVGFRVIEKSDASRPLESAPGGRPIQISLWYPSVARAAAGADAARMRYRDYMALGLVEKSFGAPSPEAVEQMLGEYRKFLESTGVGSDEVGALLAVRMHAVRDAARAPGRFPLILLAPGNAQSADDMAALAEGLASRGFLVASVPSPTRISGPMQSEADIPAKAAEQASDLAFARQALAGEARPGRVGVVGHSFGARSALLLAMREPEVAAVASLDGGIGSGTGKGMLEKAPGFSLAKMRAPLLHFSEDLDPQMAPDFGLIRSLGSCPRWIVRTSDMHHVHFTTVGALVAASPGLFRATSSTPATPAGWDAVVETTASFLEAFVGSEKRTPARWQVPVHRLFRVEKLPASR